MTKFAGLVGYVTQEETVPGVWSSVYIPRRMKGDVLRQSASSQSDGRLSSEKVNKDVSFSHRISLVGDAYAFGNYFNIKWIELDGYRWEVSSIEPQRPRLIVTLGGLWSEE